MSDQSATNPEDARAALSAVAAMKAASERRAAWPLWLSLSVALAYGLSGALATTSWGSAPRMFVGGAAALAAIASVFLVQRFRGVKHGRVIAVRLGPAVAIHLVIFFATQATFDPFQLDGAGPLIFGAIEAAVILAAFALIGWVERNGIPEGGR